jgi:hypothetical protein
MKDLSGGALYVSFLRALTNKQLLALEAWQYERRSVEATRTDAEYRLTVIKQIQDERG